MQKGYHNVDGWLGFIIGDKIFVDFTKYSFEDSMNRLTNQINMITKQAFYPPIMAASAVVVPEQKAIQHQLEAQNDPSLTTSSANNPVETKVIKIVFQGGANNNSNNNNKQEPNFSSLALNKIEQWSESEVKNWFNEIDLHESFIYKQFATQTCTGELLSQLHQIQMYAPEFFFKAIMSNATQNVEDLTSVAMFSIHLKKLFQS